MGLDYYAVDDVLAEFDPTESVAFLHGSLLARLVSGERLRREEWLDAVRSLLEIEAEFTQAQAEPIQLFYDESLQGLEPKNAEPQGPLLPVHAPLADRLEALAEWCAAFVSTLGMVGKLHDPAEDDKELLSDLIAISQLDPSAETDAAAEADFDA
ncbi:MAG: UPF0149 family protein, partial [Natronospirillum sp.]